MIKCNRCKELTHEKFIHIHKCCEYCGLTIEIDFYEFTGNQEEANRIGGIWTSTPEVNGLYDKNDTRFCSMDGSIELLASVYPNLWKNLTNI